MPQIIAISRGALQAAAATVVGLVILLAAGGLVIGGPTVWSQWNGRTTVEILRQGSLERQVRIYRPTVTTRRPALVLNLQAAGGNGALQEALTGFDRQADRLGWIVAYPDSGPAGWNTFACCRHVDDVGFLANLIDRLEATKGVDPDRVYVTGASRGGMMAYRLGCELSFRVAAIAPVAGNMANANGSADAVTCEPGRTVSVLDVHGSADPEVPIEGGRSRMNAESISYAPLTDVIGRWRAIDRCSVSPATTISSASTLTAWSCQDGGVVESLIVNGAGHTWPGAAIVNPPGTPAAAIDGSRLIADFFASLGPRRPALR